MFIQVRLKMRWKFRRIIQTSGGKTTLFTILSVHKFLFFRSKNRERKTWIFRRGTLHFELSLCPFQKKAVWPVTDYV